MNVACDIALYVDTRHRRTNAELYLSYLPGGKVFINLAFRRWTSCC